MGGASGLCDAPGSPLHCLNSAGCGKRRRGTDWRSACGSWSFPRLWEGPCTKEFHDALNGRGDVTFEIGGHLCSVNGHSRVLGEECGALGAQFSSPLGASRHVVRFDSWVSLETLKGFLELLYLKAPCEGCRWVDARELWVICDLLLARRLLERLALEVDRDNFAVAMATAVHLGYSETNVLLLQRCVEPFCLSNAFDLEGNGTDWPVDFCDAVQRVVHEMLGASKLSRFSRAEDVVLFLCKVQVDCGEDWTLALRDMLDIVPLRHVSAATLEKAVRCALLFRHERDEALTSQCLQVHSPCPSIRYETTLLSHSTFESAPPEIDVVGEDGKRIWRISFDPVFKPSDVAYVGDSQLWISVPDAKSIMVVHSESGDLCRTIQTSFEPSKVIANRQGCVLVMSSDHRAYLYHALVGWCDLCTGPVLCACAGAWGEFYVCTKSEVLIFSPYGVALNPSYSLSEFPTLFSPSWVRAIGCGRFSFRLCHLEDSQWLTYVVDVVG